MNIVWKRYGLGGAIAPNDCGMLGLLDGGAESQRMNGVPSFMWRLHELSLHNVAVKMNPEIELVRGDGSDIITHGRAMCTVDKNRCGEMTWLTD